jgi:hypothetical protein
VPGIWSASLAAFVAGSAYSTIVINWGRRNRMRSQHAYPFFWEGMLLLCFGSMDNVLARIAGPARMRPARESGDA